MRRANPVFDEDEVHRMAQYGVNRLATMQCADGGWGWFSGWGEYSYPHTTALVVHGLQLAKANGVAVDDNMLERGVQWLQNYQAESASPNCRTRRRRPRAVQGAAPTRWTPSSSWC